MPSTFRVAFLGFTEFERSALGSYFRLANRDPHYVQVQMLTDADFLVADADHVPSMQLVAATDRMAQTVFIGSQPPPGAVAWMTRPIDALHVMRELDAMVTLLGGADGKRSVTAGKPTAAPRQWGSRLAAAQPSDWNSDSLTGGLMTPVSVWEPSESLLERSASQPLAPPPISRRMAAAKAAAGSEQPVVAPAAPPAPRPPPTEPPADPPPQPPRALIVDDSPIAQRYLEMRLLRWGLVVDRAETSGRARQLMLRNSYDLVFLDVELGPDSELDGLALCRQIKQSIAAVNLTVVIVSAHHSELDRVRGALAGCDAYLGKPLDQAELDELLLRQGLRSPTAVRKKYKRAATSP